MLNRKTWFLPQTAPNSLDIMPVIEMKMKVKVGSVVSDFL